MASIEEIREGRLKKLEILKDSGIDPYPAKVPRDFDISVLKNDFDRYEKEGKPVSVAGRVMIIRD